MAVADPGETRSDEELVRLILIGQVEVYSHLYERYHARIYRLAYGMVGRPELAEDLAQEVFIRAYQKLELFGAQSSFSTWFYRLALNHCLNYCEAKEKQRHREVQQSEEPCEPAPLPSALRQLENRILQKQRQEQIHKALLSLQPKFRLAVILKDIEGLSYEEIAERLNCSTGTVGSQLKRARRLLAKKLEHLRGTL